MTSTPAPVLFRERLWPSAWVFIVSALVMPASLLGRERPRGMDGSDGEGGRVPDAP